LAEGWISCSHCRRSFDEKLVTAVRRIEFPNDESADHRTVAAFGANAVREAKDLDQPE
jgi:hypothetical protein